jgi:hypothetical protein
MREPSREEPDVTIPNFAGYTPPGVYVNDVSGPIVTTTGVFPQILTIVGPALGYRTAVQSMQAYAGTGALLSFTGVFTAAQAGPPAVGAPVVTLTGTSTVLAHGTDYSFTTTPDPSGNAAMATTALFRVSTSTALPEGGQVTITYNYADVTYYQPQLFTNFPAVTNAYGQPLVTTPPTTPNTSQVANPLSYAAQIAFSAGANQLICVALNPADGQLQQQLIAAYGKVAATYDATLIVPVFPDYLGGDAGGSNVAQFALSLAQDLAGSCIGASGNGYPRIGFFGLPADYSESDMPITAFTSSVASLRLVVPYPEVLQAYNPVTRLTFNISACYLAVALAAMLSALPVNTGLTGQSVPGFAGITASEAQLMTPAFMNSAAAAGACVVFQNRSGALAVRHGVTTDMSALNTREISIIRQGDALLVALQTGLDNSGLIGTPITANTVATVQGAIVSILQQAVLQGTILAYTNLTVSQNTYPAGDPTIISASFTYAPSVPLNYIQVTYAIDLTTGLVSTQSQQNASAPVAV